MKRSVVVKILIDISMLVLYLMLMFVRGFGGLFHEIVGIGIGVLFVTHILLNRSMTKGLIKSVKSGKAKSERVMLALSDLLLAVCMPIVIVSGILIAKDLFMIPFDIPWQLIFTVHNVLSYVCLGLMAFHLFLHGKYLIGVFKKLPTLSSREAIAAFGRFAVGAVAAAVLYVSLYVYKDRTDDMYQIIENDQNDISVQAPQYSDAPSSSAAVTEVITETNEAGDTVVNEKAQQTVNSDKSEVITHPQPTNPPSLEEYLSNLFCSGCHRHCPLISPRCGKGEEQSELAKEEFVQLYGEG